jgi:hypothetical protein
MWNSLLVFVPVVIALVGIIIYCSIHVAKKYFDKKFENLAIMIKEELEKNAQNRAAD